MRPARYASPVLQRPAAAARHLSVQYRHDAAAHRHAMRGSEQAGKQAGDKGGEGGHGFIRSLVGWFVGYLVIWLFGYLVIWLFGYLVIWLFGYLVFLTPDA